MSSLLFFLFTSCIGEIEIVTDPITFLLAAQRAKPGDEIIIKDGIYHNSGQWQFVGSGTKEAPIRIRSETPYGAVFSGRTQFQLRGDHLQLVGLYFKEASFEGKVVGVEGDHNRISSNFFVDSGNSNSALGRLLHIGHGRSYNRIDHNYFRGSISISISQFISSDQGYGVYNRIDHNVLRDIVRLNSKVENGQEGIQIGQSSDETSEAKVYALIEENLFDNVVADAEIISIKSSNNLIRNNQFVSASEERSVGELTLRNGSENSVIGNIFTETHGGVRIVGDTNLVVQNTVQLADYGVRFFHGTGDLGIYNQPKGNYVAHNSIIETQFPIRIVNQIPEATEPPRNNRILRNLVISMRHPWLEGPEESLAQNQIESNAQWLWGNPCFNSASSKRLRPIIYSKTEELPQFQGDSGHSLLERGINLSNRKAMQRRSLRAEFAILDKVPLAGEPLLLDGAFSHGDPTRFAWDLGDGETLQSEEMVVSHVYDKPGTYLVQLQVQDNEGETHTTSQKILIHPSIASSLIPSHSLSSTIPQTDLTDTLTDAWNPDQLRKRYMESETIGSTSAPTITIRLSTRPSFQEEEGTVLIEAEHYHRLTMNVFRPPWQIETELSDSVKNCYIQAPRPSKQSVAWEESGQVSYLIALTTPGTYNVWLRRYAKGLGDNSLYWSINGAQQSVADNERDGLGQWHWIQIGQHHVERKSADVTSLGLRYRENDYRIDQILLTQGDGPDSLPRK
ncbi:MAG: chondroitinase-B domain-containing protein [Chloroflexota bacterium]